MSDLHSSADRGRLALRERVVMPGLFLAIAGVLNLVLALVVLGVSAWVHNLPEEELKEGVRVYLERLDPQQREQLPQEFATPEGFVRLVPPVLKTYMGGGSLAAVIALASIVGGLRMRRLRSRGLAITGAALMAIPCLSPLSCCLVGEVVGIWCLVVLFSNEVADAFSEAARDTSAGA